MGTCALSVSISQWQESNAGARCAAATTITTLTSPTNNLPNRCCTLTLVICQRRRASATNLAISDSAIGSWASYSSPRTRCPPSLSRTTPMKVAIAPSPAPAMSWIRAAALMTSRVSKGPSESATCGWGNECQLGAIVQGRLPVRVLLVDGAAERRLHRAQPGKLARQRPENGRRGGLFGNVQLQLRPSHDLPRPGEDEHRHSHRAVAPAGIGSSRIRAGRNSAKGRTGAASCQYSPDT